ncbi:hypothetical protein RRG08_036593 [Elysia crispata]|uniref:Uncharacterized protein n=1 Tax=Elysia crispata TaxID=231223 RepID=A0AAE0ZQU1_9GAST|nr:hypothetical protein RRG08_036593 [Elysia crispata]
MRRCNCSALVSERHPSRFERFFTRRPQDGMGDTLDFNVLLRLLESDTVVNQLARQMHTLSNRKKGDKQA